MGDEHRLTKTFAIRPSAFEGRGRYELLHTTEDRDNVRSRVIVRAGTAADVRALGEALVRFVDIAHAEPARVPCEGWRELAPNVWVLDAPNVPPMVVYRRDPWWHWYPQASPGDVSVIGIASLNEAMLAAEDAAADLLRAGLRAMGRE